MKQSPTSLDFTAVNLAQAWKCWRENFELYLNLALEEEKQEKLLCLDTRCTLEQLLKSQDEYCLPEQNETMKRYNFFMRQPGTEEGLEMLM